MNLYGFLPIALWFVFTGRVAGDDNCTEYFKKRGFVPKFADCIKSTNLQVQYAGKNISCGSMVNLVQVLNPPTLYYNAPSCCQNITVLEFVPDEPFTVQPFNLWLTLNVPPENLRKGFTTPLVGNTDNNGYNAGSYIQPKSADVITIVFFVYCQCGEITDKTMYLEPLRGGFDIKGYAKKNRLGTPMAAFYHKYTDTGIALVNGAQIPNVL